MLWWCATSLDLAGHTLFILSEYPIFFFLTTILDKELEIDTEYRAVRVKKNFGTTVHDEELTEY